MGNYAAFTIDLVGSNPPRFDATHAATSTFRLESPRQLVQRWTMQVFGPNNPDAPAASEAAPLLTLVGATSGELVDATDPSGTITITWPATGTHSFKVRSLVNGGLDANGNKHPDYIFERVVALRAPNGLRKIVDNEATTYEQRGVANAQNEQVDVLGGTGLTVIGSPQILDVPTWNGSAAEWQPQGGLQVLSFGPVVSLYEVGQSVVNPAFTASYNRTPTTAILTNNLNGESKDVHLTPTAFASSQTYLRSTPNQTVTWTLTTSNGVRSAGATWGQKMFWGTSLAPANTSAFGRSLAGSGLSTARNLTFTATPVGSDKIYLYLPTRYGTPTFTAGGFVGGYILRSSTISDTNAQGYTENYSLWETVAAGLPTTTTTVS